MKILNWNTRYLYFFKKSKAGKNERNMKRLDFFSCFKSITHKTGIEKKKIFIFLSRHLILQPLYIESVGGTVSSVHPKGVKPLFFFFYHKKSAYRQNYPIVSTTLFSPQVHHMDHNHTLLMVILDRVTVTLWTVQGSQSTWREPMHAQGESLCRKTTCRLGFKPMTFLLQSSNSAVQPWTRA